MFDATGWTLCEPPLEERHDSVAPPLLMPPRFKLPAPSLAGEDVAPLVVPLLDGAPPRGLDGLNDPALREPPSRGGVAIVRRFEFSSNHQRMSVVGRTDVERGSHVFLKGAPEVVASLCDPDTVPADFTAEVRPAPLSPSGVGWAPAPARAPVPRLAIERRLFCSPRG